MPTKTHSIPLAQAARLIGMSRWTLKDWVNRGRVKSSLDIWGYTLIPTSEVDRLKAEKAAKTA